MWYFVVIFYILLGVIIILATPARKEVFNALSTKDLPDGPLWKARLYQILVAIAVMLFWPFFIPGLLKNKKSLLNDLEKNQIYQDQKAIMDAMSKMCDEGCDTDEIPNCIGEFGYVSTNPIPTRTVFGSTSYLGRLRSSDGTKVIYERKGSLTSTVSPYPIDIYMISHPDGRSLATLYLSPYQKRNSKKAPAGFTLIEYDFGKY